MRVHADTYNRLMMFTDLVRILSEGIDASFLR